jgi:hypothetical protein
MKNCYKTEILLLTNIVMVALLAQEAVAKEL